MGAVAEAVGLYPVRLLPGGRVFLVEPGEDVLTAGLRQGIDLRYGCRHGKCTTCKYVVVEGDVAHVGASPYAFSDREREEGGVLLCSTFARSPLVITPFGEPPADDGSVLIPPQERTARVVSLVPASADLVELRLRPDAPLSYRPGQYPSGALAFLVDAGHRRVLDPLAAAPGRPVTLLGPFGRLFHRPANRPILMAATGAGIGPLLAILRELRAAGGSPPIRLWYGARPGGIPHADELAALAGQFSAFQFEPVELPAEGPVGLRLGRIVQRIGRDVPDASGHDAYVAGPVALGDALEALLTAKGLPERRFFCERFYAVAS